MEAELRDYVERKRRAKDGLALKARTKSDYLAAIEPPRVTKSGTRRAAGLCSAEMPYARRDT